MPTHQTVTLLPESSTLLVRAIRTGLYYSVESFDFHGTQLEYLTAVRKPTSQGPALRTDFYPNEVVPDFTMPVSITTAKELAAHVRHDADNDGHCHGCGAIVNTDYHDASGCQCKIVRGDGSGSVVEVKR